MKALLITLLMLWTTTNGGAQSIITYSDSLLDHPEDIAFDEERSCFYIANVNADVIVRMDTAGHFSLMLDSINSPMSVAVCGDTLLITSNYPSTITGLDLTTSQVLYQVAVPEALYLAQIETDLRTGYAYIVEQRGMIVRFNFRSPAYSILVPLGAGLDYGSQSSEVDTSANLLYVFKWPTGYIKGVNLDNPTQITNVAQQVISQITASTSAPSGGCYVSSWWGNSIYKYTPSFSGQPVNISTGHNQPAGLVYCTCNHSLYVCNYGNNTIDRVVLPETAVKENGKPMKFNLEQNHPNPFNPTTRIRFHLSHAGFTKLAVYDMLGREVALLIRADLQPGTYEQAFEAHGLASGMYLYTLESGDMIQSRKLLLLR